jgi:NAD(P)H-flavin reductase
VTAATDQRAKAPLGARVVTITDRRRHGAYIVLSCADPIGPRPQAGQFYMLRSAQRWGGGESERPFLPRAFSVLRARPAPGSVAISGVENTAGETDTSGDVELQFLLEAVGPGTVRLAELGPGDGLSLVGPLGRGFTPPRGHRRPILVGGGVGIAPLAIWQDELGPQTAVLLGFRDAEHAAGADLLHAPQLATDDGSRGHRGLITDLLTDALGDDPEAEVYACGPPPMLAAVHRLCAEREVPAQLALEAGMACGFGACFGCVVATARGYIRLCLEGPVLAGEELSAETFAVAGMGHSG